MKNKFKKEEIADTILEAIECDILNPSIRSNAEIQEHFPESQNGTKGKKFKWKAKKKESINAYVKRLEKLTTESLPTLGEAQREKFLRLKLLEGLPVDVKRLIKMNAINKTWKETVKTAFSIIETVNVETK